MPKTELKQIQKELENGLVRPVYWLVGRERMKSRELLRRIRKAVLGDGSGSDAGGLGFAEETLDGNEVGADVVVEATQSLSLGGGTRLVIVRDAHLIQNPESIEVLFEGTGPVKKENLSSVCVFLVNELDGRRKFSKTLMAKSTVVPCEEVAEDDRENWIAYLAKRRGQRLSPQLIVHLRSLDPWSLDIVDLELEKLEIASLDASKVGSAEDWFGNLGIEGGTEAFIEAFFCRNRFKALELVQTFAEHPDEALPLLGLLAWNIRYLVLFLSVGGRSLPLSSYVQERFVRWSKRWTLSEALQLQKRLAELDFDTKQTPLLPLGLWGKLVMEFCLPSK